MIIGWSLGIVSVVIASLAQILLKRAAEVEEKKFINKFLNLRVVTAYVLLFFSLFVNTFVLRHLELKILPCITATSFLWILLFSYLFLGEKPSSNKVIGMVMIMVGVIVAQF